MKISLLLISVLLCTWTSAQTLFEWASAPEGVDMEYIYMNAMPDGGVFAISDNDQLNEMRSLWKFVDGKGKEYEDRNLTGNSNAYMLMMYDENGGLRWWQRWSEDNLDVLSSKVGEDGKIYLLVYLEYDDYFDNYDDYDDDEEELEEDEESEIEYGAVPDYHNDDYIKVRVGHAIVQLSTEGRVEQVISLGHLNDDESEIELVDLELYGADQYLIAGSVEDGSYTAGMDLQCNGEGGDFIMLLDKDGNKVWWDIIVNRTDRCCSSNLDGNHIAVAKDGTIYFGFSYDDVACFSNGLQRVASHNYKVKYHREPMETCVIAYSPEGKINWIKAGEGNSLFRGIVATANGLCVAHRIQDDVRSFGEEVDTIGHWNIVFTQLDKKGKLEWNLVTELSSVGSVIVDTKQNVVAAGALNKNGKNYVKAMKLGDIEVKERIESVVVKISPKGTVADVWGGDFGTKGFESPLLVQNSKGKFFLATEVSMGGGIRLNLYYKELPEVVNTWGAAVLGKIKF